MMRENKTIADLIAALRSGQYKKGTGRLKATDVDTGEAGFCCEGVMCEISGVPVVAEQEDSWDTHIVVTSYQGDEGSYNKANKTFAPASVWVGTGADVGEDGETIQLWLPEYEVTGAEYVNDRYTQELRFDRWEKHSFAGLNDTAAGGGFTFDQIADLMEWAYVRNYGNA